MTTLTPEQEAEARALAEAISQATSDDVLVGLARSNATNWGKG